MADSPRIEELKRRVQSDPASIAFAALAEEYRRAGRFEEAIATCNTGLQRHPSYLSAHVTLGRALLEIGRFEEAQEELEYVLKLAPENLAAIRGLAEIHHRRGDDEPAGARHATPATVAPPDFRLKPEGTETAGQPDFPLKPEGTETAGQPDFPLKPEGTETTGQPDFRLKQEGTETAAEAAQIAGLEEFLAAIQRARAERHSGAR